MDDMHSVTKLTRTKCEAAMVILSPISRTGVLVEKLYPYEWSRSTSESNRKGAAARDAYQSRPRVHFDWARDHFGQQHGVNNRLRVAAWSQVAVYLVINARLLKTHFVHHNAAIATREYRNDSI